MRLFIFYVYILTNKHRSVFYIGMTNDLERRCFEHKAKKINGFTKRYNVDELVYFEKYDYIEEAIFREKQIKKYSRAKKIELIESINKDWKNLYINGRINICCL